MLRLLQVLLVVVPGVVLVAPGAAHAYLDAGTGSIIIQAAIAGFVGAMFAIKLYWGKLVGFFKGKSDKDDGGSGQ